MYRRILVTLDGSETSEAVLPEVERLAEDGRPQVTLLTVAEEPRSTSEFVAPTFVGGAPVPGGVRRIPAPRVLEDRGQALEAARQKLLAYLEERAKPLRAKGMEVETHVAFGEPVEEILAFARAAEVDVVMLATHGRTGLAQVIFGSVAARVVGSGVRPVLLVRPARLKSGAGA